MTLLEQLSPFLKQISVEKMRNRLLCGVGNTLTCEEIASKFYEEIYNIIHGVAPNQTFVYYDIIRLAKKVLSHMPTAEQMEDFARLERVLNF